MSAAATKQNDSSEGSGMRAASSICQPGPAPTETLIETADELMACIGRLRTIEPGMETSPLARVLDRILDARTILMRARDAGKVGVLLLLLLLGALALPAEAARYKFAWNPNPESDRVTYYNFWKLTLTGRELLGNTPGTTIEADAEPGEFVAVSAVRVDWQLAITESALSKPLLIPLPSASPTMMRLTIQRSNDLKTWADTTATVEVPKAEREFFRIRMEEVKP